MKILRYGEKVVGAGPTLWEQGSQTRCSVADCTEVSEFHCDLRGASRRTVEFCAAHIQQARNSDVEFDFQMRDFLERQSKTSAGS